MGSPRQSILIGEEMKIVHLFFAFIVLVSAQDMLSNESVVKMMKAGLGEGLIVGMIQNQPGKYSLTPDDLVKLKTQGVSDKILGAMIARGSGGTAATTTAAADSDMPANIEIGVYFKKNGKWEEMLPEVVNWKTGGVVKNIASAGIVKGDVNGHVQGPHSRNSAVSPVEALVYAPEGVAITEYQLIHLRDQKESREFRTVTGGVMHVSGGATRDLIPFEGKKMTNRVYRVVLPSLGAGEYGFLPPGAISSANSASIGKMFTFRIIE
jgi:hypothetical protein